jgi:chitin disaccharide deacetylase
MPGDVSANHLLGYPDDARLLIVNADDLGMSGPVNEGVIDAIGAGLVQSTSLLVPGFGCSGAMEFLRGHPEVDLGVHLALVSDAPGWWAPVLPSGKVASLVDERGNLYPYERRADLLRGARVEEVEAEFRAQIGSVLGAGLRPTHLDWHCLADGGRDDIFELTVALARENGLALRTHAPARAGQLCHLGLPVPERGVLDSYSLEPVGKHQLYLDLLHDLPEGLSEWAVHPAADRPTLREMEPEGWQRRCSDLAFLVSPAAREAVRSEGVTLLGYAELQKVWSASTP